MHVFAIFLIFSARLHIGKGDKQDLELMYTAFCVDGRSNLRILGVGTDEKETQVIVTGSGTATYVQAVFGESLIVLSEDRKNPVLKPIEPTDKTMSVSNKTLIFRADEAFFRIQDMPQKYSPYFGGWNQVIVGCPQPLCIDAHFDAIIEKGDGLLVFRGLYFWYLDLKVNRKAPTIGGAKPISDHFPTVDAPIAAAASDSKSNFYIFDYKEQVHIYISNISQFYCSILPASHHNSMTLEEMDKIFRLHPFYLKQLSPSGYFVVKPLNLEAFLDVKVEKFLPEAALITAIDEGSAEDGMFVLSSNHYLSDILSEALKRMVANLISSNDAYEDSTIGRLLQVFTSTVALNRTPKQLNSLQRNFPTRVHSAFTLNKDIYLNQNWQFYKVDGRQYSLFNKNKLDDKAFNQVGQIMTSILGCDSQDYTKWGFGSFEEFFKQYSKLLKTDTKSEIRTTKALRGYVKSSTQKTTDYIGHGAVSTSMDDDSEQITEKFARFRYNRTKHGPMEYAGRAKETQVPSDTPKTVSKSSGVSKTFVILTASGIIGILLLAALAVVIITVSSRRAKKEVAESSHVDLGRSMDSQGNQRENEELPVPVQKVRSKDSTITVHSV